MQLRRAIITDLRGAPRRQKAVAFALLLKSLLGRASIIPNYSVNKIRALTGLSATAIKNYMATLQQMGYVRYCGRNKQHIVIASLASHTTNRNINVDAFCFKTFKDVYNSLRAYIALAIQHRKDYIRRTLQIVNDPHRGQDYRSARKKVKRLVKHGILASRYDEYREYGLSYTRIAKELGNCARTAFNVMQYAVKKHFAHKNHNQEQIFAYRVTYMRVCNTTFSTLNNIYIIHANTYTLCQRTIHGLDNISL